MTPVLEAMLSLPTVPSLVPPSQDRTLKGPDHITWAEGLQTLRMPRGVEPWVCRLRPTLP